MILSKNPYLKRISERGIGHSGREAEKKLAKRLGSTVRPGSGNKDGCKGDVAIDTQFSYLIENKSTVNDSFKVDLGHLLKIYQEALETNRVPALTIQFTTMAGKSEKRGRWVMVPESHWQEITDGT